MATIAPNDWGQVFAVTRWYFQWAGSLLEEGPRWVTASASYGLVSVDVDLAGATPITHFRIPAEHLSGGEVDG